MIQLKTPKSYHPMIRMQRGHPEVYCKIEVLTDILVAPRSTSSGNDSKDSPESLRPEPLLSDKSKGKHNLLTLSQGCKLRDLQAYENYKGLLADAIQKSHKHRAIKFGRITTADH